MEQVTSSIYYHCFCVNDFEDRFIRTYKKISLSGLLSNIDEIKLICIGKPSIHFLNMEKVHVITYNGKCNTEAATLNYIRNFNTSDNILYLHSKGVTRPHNRNVNAWVDYMEYFCIEQYKNRLKDLKEYDSVGVELQAHYEFTSSLLFSGNFWWSTNSHIKSLSFCNEENRHLAEMWVCSNPQGKYKCLHTNGNDLYHTEYVRENYTKELPII